MNRLESLLASCAEEAIEVGQRCTKAQRFGLDQAQPGHDNNLVRILHEFVELVAVLNMAGVLMIDKDSRVPVNADLIAAKKAKVDAYLTDVAAADAKYLSLAAKAPQETP